MFPVDFNRNQSVTTGTGHIVIFARGLQQMEEGYDKSSHLRRFGLGS